MERPILGHEMEPYIQERFTQMREQLGMGERQVFNEAGETGPIYEFLHSVITCPESVLAFCEAALKKDSPQRKRYAERQREKGTS